MILSGKVVSRRTGEMAGSCPIKGIGRDRFHWWPKGTWYCRHECFDCPGERAAAGGMRGWLSKLGASSTVIEVSESPPLTIEMVDEYAHNLNDEALAYLAGRGIIKKTARRYRLGRTAKRLTIPCIWNDRVIGIKKRWLGVPPENYISKYTMAPGSKGKAIFNFKRLVQRRWRYVLIVEGVLDCILLDQLRIPAVAPFGGGTVWSEDWTKYFSRVRTPVVVADWDRKDSGGSSSPGTRFATSKLKMLGRGLLVYPPSGHKDIGEAYHAGEDLRQWLKVFRDAT